MALSKAKREKRKDYLLKQQDGKCFYCDMVMNLVKKNTPEYVTFEHLIRRSMGGTFICKNIVLACHNCNTLKAHIENALELSIDFDLFKQYVSHYNKPQAHHGKNKNICNFVSYVLIHDMFDRINSIIPLKYRHTPKHHSMLDNMIAMDKNARQPNSIMLL